MLEPKQNGGRRDGAGRPKGSLNKRSLDAIQAVAEKFPDWTPLQHMAAVANDETLDVEIRLDAAKSAAPYVHARLKPVVADADALVDLEARIAKARLEAQAAVLDEHPGLGDRLARALAREAEETALLAASRPVVLNVAPEPPSDPVPTRPKPVASPEPAPETEPEGASHPGDDWSAQRQYEPILPSKPQFVACDYENDPNGLLADFRDGD